MSLPLRQKILDEFLKTGGKKRASAIRKYRQNWVKDFFDRGQIRIENDIWTSTFYEAASNIPEEDRATFDIPLAGGSIPTTQWNKIYAHLEKELKTSMNEDFVTYTIDNTSTTITVKYVRGTKRKSAPKQGDIDLEIYVDKRIKLAMESFFKTGDFEKIAKSVIKAAATKTKGTGMTISHGDEREPQFGSSIPDSTKMSKKDIADKLKSGKETAPGAKGTLVSKRFLKAIIKSCKQLFSTAPWFSKASETIDAKWEELFGYSSSVKDRDTKSAVQSNVELSAEVIPSKILNKLKLNRGVFDKALSDEIVKFLKDEDYFAEELIRLRPGTTAMEAAAITTGSDSVFDRIPKVTTRLAQIVILEKVSKKFIKNAKKTPKGTKKGSNKTNNKFSGAGSSKVERTNARKGNIKSATNRRATEAPQTAVALKELINQALPEVMLTQMQPPALRNRTGRFRQSAEVTNVNIGPRGGTQIDYTYMRDPYETFEPGGDMGSRNRDPRKLIGASVREIAIKLTGNKFITTRRR